VFWRNITDTGFPETPASRLASLSDLAENEGGLNRSMQHRLEVYSQEFQSPRFFAGVDLSAALLCRFVELRLRDGRQAVPLGKRSRRRSATSHDDAFVLGVLSPI
jgi:hypothetical protein